jgi:hypothetical protein
MKRSSIFLTGIFLMALQSSCSSVTPHENFMHHLAVEVGRNIYEIDWNRSAHLLSTVNLPNGHLLYTYAYTGTCRVMFEVVPETNIISSAKWEGSENDCAIVP